MNGADVSYLVLYWTTLHWSHEQGQNVLILFSVTRRTIRIAASLQTSTTCEMNWHAKLTCVTSKFFSRPGHDETIVII